MSNKKYKDPIGVLETVDELPPRHRQTNSDTVVEAAIDAKGKWLLIDKGGRQPSSVRTTIDNTAQRMEVPVEVAVRNGEVYIRAIQANG